MRYIDVGFVLGVLAMSAISGAGVSRAAEDGPVIHTEDVASFYTLYDATGAHPTAAQLQAYLDAGSDGLHAIARLRNVTGQRIADTIAKRPDLYAGAKRCMAVLPQVRQRLVVAFRNLKSLYPQAQFPPVTIFVGRGKPVGVADGSGVMIGLEALCGVTWMNPNVEDRFVHVIAHEYTHVQQALLEPAFYNRDKPTVLERSLVEGAAELTAELISGEAGEIDNASNKGHEKDIETAFVHDEDNTDLSKWVDNGTMETQGDLGYWIGYRIVKSYYQHAVDKRQAFREILTMTDAKAFLARSGWYPGIELH